LPTKSARSLPASAAALVALLLLSTSARAEGPLPPPPPGPPAPAPAPAPAPPPVEEKKPEPPRVSFAEGRVESDDGWVVWYYRVNFVDPGILRAEVDRWKSAGATVEPMAGPGATPINTLRIRERRENLPLMERMLELLDQPLPQVLVRAKLVEITYDGNLEWGFEAAFDRGGADPDSSSETFLRKVGVTFNPESYLSAGAARPFQGSSLNFAFLGDTRDRYGSLDYTIRALKSRGHAEILGEPNILATQGVQAKFRAGEKIPYQTANLQGSAVIVSTTLQDTGISLTLTPELIGRDAVRMKINQEFSAVSSFLAGQGGVLNPVINQRSADTTVVIRDGATLVVGGLQSSRVTDSRTGIPLLMDIPLLGAIFSKTQKSEVKTELYFFVTPEIVRGSYSDGLLRPPSEEDRLEGLRNER
jgi:general secretion pathway protein D